MSARSLVLPLVLLVAACGGGGRGANAPRRDPEPRQARDDDRKERREEAKRDARAEERRDDARDKRVDARSKWDKLGERTVEGKTDRDTIAVSRADGRFSAIQLKVEGSALEMFDVTITFGDDSSFSPPTRLVFAKDTTSRVIDLPGDKRAIKRVEFKYGNLPGGGRAQVELWAR